MSVLQEKLAGFKKNPAANNGNGGGHDPYTAAWQRLIDEKLDDWSIRPEQFDEEGVKAPTRKALWEALYFSVFFRNDNVEPPLRVAPDGSGGIAFEWRKGNEFDTVEIDANGKMVRLLYENGKLVVRQPLG